MGSNAIEAITSGYNKANKFLNSLATGDYDIKKVKFPPIFSGNSAVGSAQSGNFVNSVWDGYGSQTLGGTNI